MTEIVPAPDDPMATLDYDDLLSMMTALRKLAEANEHATTIGGYPYLRRCGCTPNATEAILGWR